MREACVVGSILTDTLSLAVVLSLFVYLCLQYAVIAFRRPTSNLDGRLVPLMRGTAEPPEPSLPCPQPVTRVVV